MSVLDAMAAAMPWVALVLSAVSVVLAVVMWRRHAQQAENQLARGLHNATSLGDYGGINVGVSELQAMLKSLQEKLARLVAEQSASARLAGGVPYDDEDATDGRIERFIDLVMEWGRITGHALQGAAAADWKVIDELTVPGRRATRAGDMAAFMAAARRVVEYAVRASGTRAVKFDEEQVGRVLEELAAMAELKLIEPQWGQRYDSDLHEVVDKVTAGTGNRSETIAKVEARGLVRKDGSVMKAKVYLYD